jgi:radical SAM superfamily enzyme YgiQ (UPF0313 family)
MRILLISLPAEGKTQDFTTPDYIFADFMRYPPMGLLAIATGLDPRHTVKVIDFASTKTTIEEAARICLEWQPDLLGVSVVTRYLYAFAELTGIVRRSNPRIVVAAGGPHVNVYPLETMRLNTVDYGFTGYCELKFPKFVDALDRGDQNALSSIPGLYLHSATTGEVIMTDGPEEPFEFDRLPIIDRRLINLHTYQTAADDVRMTPMYSSRGCPFTCIFCDVQDKKFYFKSASNVVDEFEEIMALGINEIYIFDDNFNLLRQRVVEICNEIIRRGLRVRWATRMRVAPFDRELAELMKRAGCSRLHVGVESLDPHILQLIKKEISIEQIRSFFRICHEVGIATMPYFIVGFPEETPEYRRTLYRQVLELKPTYVYFNILCPLPMTEYYESLRQSGIYKNDFWRDFAAAPTRDFPIPLPRSVEEQQHLVELVDTMNRRFYFRPAFLVEELLRSIDRPRIILKKARLAMVLLKSTAFSGLRRCLPLQKRVGEPHALS